MRGDPSVLMEAGSAQAGIQHEQGPLKPGPSCASPHLGHMSWKRHLSHWASRQLVQGTTVTMRQSQYANPWTHTSVTSDALKSSLQAAAP